MTWTETSSLVMVLPVAPKCGKEYIEIPKQSTGKTNILKLYHNNSDIDIINILTRISQKSIL
jgi:hypothetical protein